MSSAIIQLLVLAGIAVFLILRLRNVLGTREGFEKPRVQAPEQQRREAPEFEVIEGGPDRDIIDHVEDGSDDAHALAAMKMIEPGFSVTEFLQGARGAYEMILMAFEKGEIDDIAGFLGDDVHQTTRDDHHLAYGEPLEQLADSFIGESGLFESLLIGIGGDSDATSDLSENLDGDLHVIIDQQGGIEDRP